MQLPKMPEITPGEGGGFSIVGVLIWFAGSEKVVDWRVQLACVLGAVLVATATVLVTHGIRTGRQALVTEEIQLERDRVAADTAKGQYPNAPIAEASDEPELDDDPAIGTIL